MSIHYKYISIWKEAFRLITIISARCLQGTGDTRTPFYGLVISQTLFKLGLSYLLSVPLELGIMGIFVGLVVDYGFQALWVGRQFLTDSWVEEAEELIAERRSS